MKIVIVGGGIAGVYLANQLTQRFADNDIVLLTDENVIPYDRIHLCTLLKKEGLENITLSLSSKVHLLTEHKLLNMNHDTLYTTQGTINFDTLFLATGSQPLAPICINDYDNVSVLRNYQDAQKIVQGLEKFSRVVIIGTGPLGLEVCETLAHTYPHKTFVCVSRHQSLYVSSIQTDGRLFIEEGLNSNQNIQFFYNLTLTPLMTQGRHLILQKGDELIDDAFIIYATGIHPSIDYAKPLEKKRGIIVNDYMQTSLSHVYAVGECAELSYGFIAGHVKDVIRQADCALEHFLNKEMQPFSRQVNVDFLKVGSFDFIDISSSDTTITKNFVSSDKSTKNYEHFFLNQEKLIRYIGINTQLNVTKITQMISEQLPFSLNSFADLTMNSKGKLLCSCEGLYEDDFQKLLTSYNISSWSDFGSYSQAGRVCGRCKKMLCDRITSTSLAKTSQEKDISQVNQTSHIETNTYQEQQKKKELSQWLSYLSTQFHIDSEQSIHDSMATLSKTPVIWLEMADCSGNSESFIKSHLPSIEELFLDVLSLEYHELLMATGSYESEKVLEYAIKRYEGEYILIVEGAIPLACEGEFLRIGGQTGVSVLQACAHKAKAIIAVGSCAFDGGIVAAYPNPTQAVGVEKALQRDDIINLPGCPVNAVTIVGTLLYIVMFKALPPLDHLRRPLWAYGKRIHDTCERRGHYDNEEFVYEWGDEGAKRGWCLFKMGCKGPYAFSNCGSTKFNEGTSWPVGSGHGCFGCVEQGFSDRLATFKGLV